MFLSFALSSKHLITTRFKELAKFNMNIKRTHISWHGSSHREHLSEKKTKKEEDWAKQVELMWLESVKSFWYEVIPPKTTKILFSSKLPGLYTGTNNADSEK